MPLGMDFGAILDPKWEPKWSQVGTKIRKMRVPRRCQKNDCKNIDFGSHLGLVNAKKNLKMGPDGDDPRSA